MYLPINGANLHEFPIIGNPLGPGTAEYGRGVEFVRATLGWNKCDDSIFSEADNSLGSTLIAFEKVVLLMREFAKRFATIFLWNEYKKKQGKSI